MFLTKCLPNLTIDNIYKLIKIINYRIEIIYMKFENKKNTNQ